MWYDRRGESSTRVARERYLRGYLYGLTDSLKKGLIRLRLAQPGENPEKAEGNRRHSDLTAGGCELRAYRNERTEPKLY